MGGGGGERNREDLGKEMLKEGNLGREREKCEKERERMREREGGKKVKRRKEDKKERRKKADFEKLGVLDVLCLN